jgi:hypothetical protein
LVELTARVKMKGFLALFGCTALVVMGGCGSSAPTTYIVAGRVTYEGVAVEEGDIIFQPENALLRAEGGKIKDGEYSLKANPGKNKVIIRASKIIPGKKSMMGEPVREEYIPSQYNNDTILRKEVATNHGNRFDFTLTAKPDKK